MALQLPYIFRPHKVIKLIFKVHCTMLLPMSIDILDIHKRKEIFHQKDYLSSILNKVVQISEWMFTFKNFRNVYWHGKRHSALRSLRCPYYPLRSQVSKSPSLSEWSLTDFSAIEFNFNNAPKMAVTYSLSVIVTYWAVLGQLKTKNEKKT